MHGRDLHLFVDESKAKAYIMAIATIEETKVEDARQALRALRIGGQTSLHFKRENARRRRAILAALVEMGWGAQIVSSSHSRQDVARGECLSQIVAYASSVEARQTTLELDASVERFDRQTLFQLVAQQSLNQSLRYQLVTRTQEPCLWAADAIAWSYARGGEWRSRLEALIGRSP